MCERCRNTQVRVPESLRIKPPEPGDTIDFCRIHAEIVKGSAEPLVDVHRDGWRPMWGIYGESLDKSAPRAVMAKEVPEGWLVRGGALGSVISTVSRDKLSSTREEAEARMHVLRAEKGRTP